MGGQDDPDQLYELNWLFHYVVELIPSQCHCVLRYRHWDSWTEDYDEALASDPLARWPAIWVGWRDSLLTIGSFCAANRTEWCQQNLVLFHLADEERLADTKGGFSYSHFHSVFRNYHSNHTCDYSFLLRDTLQELGYGESDLAFTPHAVAPFQAQSSPYTALAHSRLALLNTASEEGCPSLASPFAWDAVSDAVREELSHWTAAHPGNTRRSGQGEEHKEELWPSSPQQLPPDVLHRIHERAMKAGTPSAASPSSSSQPCLSHRLFSFYQLQQARVHDGLDGASPPHVLWMPVGFSVNGVSAALEAGVLSSSVRRYLWS